MAKGSNQKQQAKDNNKQNLPQPNQNGPKGVQIQPNGQNLERPFKEVQLLKAIKNLDDFRSPADIQSLREEGYEIDYDRLIGIGLNSAVFMGHLISAPPPIIEKDGRRPVYTPGYDMASKVVTKKLVNNKRPMKTRTGNLKLALALGQTKPENNILKVIDVFKTPERVFIFMHYCTFGNVISFIRRNGLIPVKLAQKWCGQMAIALNFLHKFQVAHRNYKLENVLIDENLNAKLTGFGLSKFCVDIQTKQPIMSRTICGSEPYLAPEMLKEGAERAYDPKQSDVWAFGVGVFLCVTRRYPFESENIKALRQEQLTKRYFERDTKKRLHQPIKDLINLTFTLEPNQRPTMQALCLQSCWLNVAAQVSVPSKTTIIPHPAIVSSTGSEQVILPRQQAPISMNRPNRAPSQHNMHQPSDIQGPSSPEGT